MFVQPQIRGSPLPLKVQHILLKYFVLHVALQFVLSKRFFRNLNNNSTADHFLSRLLSVCLNDKMT